MPDDTDSEAMHVTSSVLQEVAGTSGREWDVILIEAGTSKNGNHYPAETLQAAAGLFERAPAFADHATEHDRATRPERSVRDKIGTFSRVTYGQHEVDGRMVEGLRARFKAIAPWVREVLKEAVASGEPDFVGFSIDAEGRVARREQNGRAVAWVEAISRVNSVDLVTDPAAGGRIVRLVASAGTPVVESEQTMTPEEIAKLIADGIAAGFAARDAEAATPVAAPEPEAVAEAPTAAEVAAVTEARRLLEEAWRLSAIMRTDQALAATKLSEAGRAIVRKDIGWLASKGAVTDAAITEAVTKQADYEASLTEVRPPGVPGAGDAIRITDTEHEKIEKALQGWFTGQAVDGVRPLHDLREGYARWTGQGYFDINYDQYMRGYASGYTSKNHAALRESLTRASWGELLADNLYVMMIRSLAANPDYTNWRKFVSDYESVPDFQTRHWARVGGFGDLSSVAESATYTNFTSPTDEEVTYSIGKYGNLEDFTFEMSLEGRANRVRAVPTEMARSAARTLYKFVMNLLTTDNPTMGYDSTALYHSNHGNTGTTALTVSGLNATQVAMRDQTAYNMSLEILGARNRIKHLIVPNELEARANRIVNPSDSYTYGLNTTGNTDADTSIDPAHFKGKGIEVTVYDVLTDATDWWAVADPAQVPVLVMGFLNGQQEPELFMQDGATEGSVFTADKITAKIRYIWGGTIQDHRGVYRQVVAG